MTIRIALESSDRTRRWAKLLTRADQPVEDLPEEPPPFAAGIND